MDKMYNDLMDIVNRTRKYDKDGKPTRPKPVVEEEVEESPKVDKAPKEESPKGKSSLFEGRDAITKYLNKKAEPEAKPKKATKTASKTTKKTTKSTTKKSTAKKTTTKKTTAKTTTKKTAAKNLSEKMSSLATAKALKAVEKEEPKLDLTKPKDKQLYEALRGTLFAGGTDISDYMEKESPVETQETSGILNTLSNKRKENEKEIEDNNEQKEYEKLFTSSFFEGEQEDENTEQEIEEPVDAEDVNSEPTLEDENVIDETDAQDEGEAEEMQRIQTDPKSHRFDRDIEEFNARNSSIDEKIAEYYKRKQEKINKFNESQNEDDYTVDDSSSYDNQKRSYGDIFSGEMISRDELMGVKEEEPKRPEPEPSNSLEETSFSNLYRMLNSEDYDVSEGSSQFVTPDSEDIETNISSEPRWEPAPMDEEPLKENEITTSEMITTPDEYGVREMSFTDDEMIDSEIEENYAMEDDYTYENDEVEDIYTMPNDDDLGDYIVSSNLPLEDKSRDVSEDNEVIINYRDLPELKLNLQDDEEEEEEEEPQDDTISKQEFYDEMAKLQENLINQLKTASAEALKAPESQETTSDNTINKALDIISHLTNVNSDDDDRDDDKAESLVDAILEDIESKRDEEELAPATSEVTREDGEIDLLASLTGDTKPVETTYEVAPEGETLLNPEIALNEMDLEYIVNSEKPKDTKDDYFYLSDQDKEEKSEDEFLTVYDDSKVSIEVGDINLNKNINNAVPLSKEIEKRPINDMETIYTLFGMERKKMETKDNEFKVLYVASECQPFIATGGLADVAGSLPKAIAQKGGVDIRVILPLYGNIKAEYRDKFEYLGNFTVHLSWRQEYCGIFKYVQDGVTYYFLDNERYFKRDMTYGYYDDGERFAYFCKAVVESLPLINFFPEIIHCNDWQSALVSTYIKTGNWSDFRYYKIKNIYTIHNVEYQGIYGMENLKDLFGIDYGFRNDLDYNGDINLTKAAIQFSDKFTTVSNSYCDNLKQPYCSKGLHHIIIRNEYKLSGIVNGIDMDFYNPKTDKIIYKNYDIDSISDKVANKKIWQDELGLPVDGRTPMLAIVSRLVSHKGLDLLSKIMEDVLQRDVQLVVVGTGDQRFVEYFKYLENKYPTKVRAMVDKFSSELARKAYAASDIFLMPSKVEPCGISQMISSIYGSIPIVREVGGLKDTIKDFGCKEGGNGYTFASYNPNDLLDRINQALSDYQNPTEWLEKMKICMARDFSWDISAEKYIDLYKSLIN